MNRLLPLFLLCSISLFAQQGQTGGHTSGGGGIKTAAGVVGLFSGCSGTLVLSADGQCHASGGAPGGSPLQFQFNDTGVFAGAAGLTYDKTLLMPLMQVYQMSESTATSNPAASQHWMYIDATSKKTTCINSDASSCMDAKSLNGTYFTGTSGHLVSFGAANIPADSGVVAANAVVASSPGAGLAHFAGSTQTVTSSAVVNGDLSGQIGVAHGGTALATLTAHALYAGNAASAPNAIGPDSSTTKALFSAGSSADPAFRAIAAADLPATSVPTPSGTITLLAPRGYAICTTTCTVTVPVPAAGYEFCILNDDNVSTTITLAALGSSAMYENTARTAYGTAGTGTLSATAVVGNKVCIVGRDATHYLTVSYTGVWTAS